MGITGTQNLHYTDGTDFVEDHSTNVEVLARQLDSRLYGHDLDADRYDAGLPMCVMEASGPQTFTWNAPNLLLTVIKFDTVLIDTDGMANIDAQPHAMSFNTLGYWEVGFYAWLPSMGCVGSSGALFSANNNVGLIGNVSLLSGAFQQVTDDQSGNVAAQASSLAKVDTLPATWGWITAGPNGGTNCANTLTCTYARIWAYKTRDYP